MKRVKVSRKAHFNAAHRLYRKDWSDAQNEAQFGKCSNPHYHGHNYELIVSVKGKIDPETGFVMDMKVLKDLIRSEVEDQFDHKNLNIIDFVKVSIFCTIAMISIFQSSSTFPRKIPLN